MIHTHTHTHTPSWKIFWCALLQWQLYTMILHSDCFLLGQNREVGQILMNFRTKNVQWIISHFHGNLMKQATKNIYRPRETAQYVKFCASLTADLGSTSITHFANSTFQKIWHLFYSLFFNQRNYLFIIIRQKCIEKL